MPQSDLEALLNPPSYINDIVDGSEEDQIGSNLQSGPGADLSCLWSLMMSKRLRNFSSYLFLVHAFTYHHHRQTRLFLWNMKKG